MRWNEIDDKTNWIQCVDADRAMPNRKRVFLLLTLFRIKRRHKLSIERFVRRKYNTFLLTSVTSCRCAASTRPFAVPPRQQTLTAKRKRNYLFFRRTPLDLRRDSINGHWNCAKMKGTLSYAVCTNGRIWATAMTLFVFFLSSVHFATNLDRNAQEWRKRDNFQCRTFIFTLIPIDYVCAVCTTWCSYHF